MNRIALSLAVGVVLLITGCRPFQERHIREEIEARLAAEPADTALIAAYEGLDYAPLWVETGGLSENGEAFLRRAGTAHLDALAPADHPADSLLEEARALYADPPDSRSERARTVAALELEISQAFMRYADHLANGRIDHRAKLEGYHIRHDRLDPSIPLHQAADAHVNDVLSAFAARRKGEPELRSALARFYHVAEEGGWPDVPSAETLRPDDDGEAVAPLRRRLSAEGFIAAGDRSRRFDAALASAVERFQRSRGLAEAGIAGPETLVALNSPVEDDIHRITVNVERLRTLPSDFGDRYIFVNIPDFRLRVVEAGEDEMAMRVVVGEQMHPTPVFADTMTYLVFSPYWNVPVDLAARDIVPSARENPGYLGANGYEIVDGFHPGASVYGATSGNIERVAAGELFIRQRPGPQNALGRVKFMFPNEYAIYLHDTPAGHLFTQAHRGFSNGCIRVEHPAELAEYLLEPNGWDRARVDRAMAWSDEEPVGLDRPVPVYLMYLTVWVDERGDVQFRDDIYGHDARLKAELQTVDAG